MTTRVQKATGMVFTNYQGLTHKQMENFKKAIKPLNADYVVGFKKIAVAFFENCIEGGLFLDMN